MIAQTKRERERKGARKKKEEKTFKNKHDHVISN